MNQDFDLLRAVVTATNERRVAKREVVRGMLKSSSVPVSAEVVDALIKLNPDDARSVLWDHPGHELHRRLTSYETAYAVFQCAMSDLQHAISEFGKLTQDGSIFDAVRKEEFSASQVHIQKELFAAANAAHSLKDHASYRLQKRIQISGYEAKIFECFGDDGLHDLIILLRAIIHHVQMLHAHWTIKRQFDKAEKDKIGFKLDKSELLRAIANSGRNLNEGSRIYLNGAPDSIDLAATFNEYQSRAASFHTWFRQAIDSKLMPELLDYENCQREVKKASARASWRLFLGNWLQWEKPPNPYDYLPKYLTSAQLEEVQKLPAGSQAQVDMIIAIGDKDRACDDDLRQMFYELFRRAVSAS